MNDLPYPDGAAHTAIDRLRAGFDAARQSIGAMHGLDPVHRSRIVDELRTELPDMASRAARVLGAGPVARALEGFAVDTTDPSGADGRALWASILDASTQAATAAD